MRIKAVLVIEEKNPAAVRQMAAVVGFAHSMGLTLTLVPEEDPRSEMLAWGDGVVPEKDRELAKVALKVLKKGDAVHRADLVRGTAEGSGRSPKVAGAAVSRWLRKGVLKEVPEVAS